MTHENDLESGREMTTLVSQNVAENFYQETIQAPKSPFDLSLRPPLFSEFQGQARVKERLELMVAAAKQRGDVLEHILLSGPYVVWRKPPSAPAIFAWTKF